MYLKAGLPMFLKLDCQYFKGWIANVFKGWIANNLSILFLKIVKENHNHCQ